MYTIIPVHKRFHRGKEWKLNAQKLRPFWNSPKILQQFFQAVSFSVDRRLRLKNRLLGNTLPSQSAVYSELATFCLQIGSDVIVT
jgi:hypothetical protein